MCTLTYFPEQLEPEHSARWIFFNRDEQRSRLPAQAPVLFRGSDTNYLMPLDPESGGSWMGLSGNGFFVCVINNYPDLPRTGFVPRAGFAEGQAFPRSRGLIIRDILNAGTFPDIRVLEEILRKHNYAPFFLAAFAVNRSGIWEWNGKRIRQSVVSGVRQAGILSSNLKTSDIPKQREAQFKNLHRYNISSLKRFHRNRRKAPEAAVLMRRDDARTVSVSEICLKRGGGSICYYGAPPFIWGQKSSLKFTASVGV
ncbi:MAG: NRDE family protein [Salinispira sp.]